MSLINFANESKQLIFVPAFDRFDLLPTIRGIDPLIEMDAGIGGSQSNACLWE
ncbi:MAG: hypothetical protein P8182_14010 [Deltaproteobacteria bacterium]